MIINLSRSDLARQMLEGALGSKISTAAALLLLQGCLLTLPANKAYGRERQSPQVVKVSSDLLLDQSDKSDAQVVKILGLDTPTLTLVNRGKWQEAEHVLEAQVIDSKVADKQSAWLAFAYLYLNDSAKLKALSDRLGANINELALPKSVEQTNEPNMQPTASAKS